MKDGHDKTSKRLPRTAVDWFVRLDAAAAGSAGLPDASLESWLAESSARRAALARCEAAVCMARALEADPDLGWAYDEAARLAARPPPRRVRLRALRWIGSPALAWSIAGLSVIVAVGSFVEREPEPADVTLAESAIETIAFDAGRIVPYEVWAQLAAGSPTAILPGQIVVDARSLAIMPFVVADAADEGERADVESSMRLIAAELHDAVERQLSAIPGIYVADRRLVQPYANTDLSPEQVAAQLGVRGIIEGRVASEDGRISVALRLTDAANADVMWQTAFASPPGALSGPGADRAMDMATDMASALASAGPPVGRMTNN